MRASDCGTSGSGPVRLWGCLRTGLGAGGRPTSRPSWARGPGGARALAVAVERGGWRPRPAAPLPPPRGPPLPARPLRQPRGRRAERRGAPPAARTPTTPPSRRHRLRGDRAPWAALEGRERRPAAAPQVPEGRLMRMPGFGRLRGQDPARASPRLSGTAGPAPPRAPGGDWMGPRAWGSAVGWGSPSTSLRPVPLPTQKSPSRIPDKAPSSLGLPEGGLPDVVAQSLSLHLQDSSFPPAEWE